MRIIVEGKMRIEDLYKALDKINADEIKIIDELYFNDKSLRVLAKK